MSERHDSHVEHRIQACLDGELSAREEAEVRAHVKDCEACAAAWAEMEEVGAILAADPSGGPVRPVWPAVRAQLREERSGKTTVAFRLGASFAAAAGILLGLYMGSIDVSADLEGSETDEATWSEFGSLLGTESDGSLDYLFLSTIEEEGDAL